jgi:TonB family protein
MPAPRVSFVLSSSLAAVIVLGASVSARAASRITFGPLIPVAPIAVESVTSAVPCPIPDSGARITYAYPSQSLRIPASQPVHSDAKIMLDLDSIGNLLAARVVDSSGNPDLDEQALIAARGSKYAPEVRNCNSFKRSYFLSVTFDANQ